ncbi:glycosyl hydrolase family 61-domain-containing protein [Xylariaceae sp. FL0016]|nr:glycosyl hydrolase family 61-domain-containing protein [Xylariaceae sp. FL0016]
MQFSQKFIAAVAALPALTKAHYFFPTLIVNGVESEMWQYVRESSQGYEPQYTPDILTSDDLRCNTGASSGSATEVASVAAGDTVSFVLDYGATIQHPGPVTFWMSQAASGDVTSYDGSGDWFKVAVIGYDTPFAADGTNWRSYDQGTVNVAIPATVPDGQYLLRIEHIGVHRPSTREMFFNCAQIEVTGSSATELPTGTTIPGIYSADDEWVDWSMYSSPTSFPYAGPATIGGGLFDSEGTDSSL